ncbi:MAG: hypothetical protein PHO80_00995, partial [Candidatus Gracilibacteria bacterium]|nr:hypothetical protein [Candidatus Gracilibacteria bacterium]
MKQKIYIIDGNNFLYRVFYAIPPFTLGDGTHVNAVFGMAKIIKNLFEQDKPDYLFYVMDSKEKSFRAEVYEHYKAHRPKMPENLIPQTGLIRTLLEKMTVNLLMIPGFEADDVIGTLVRTFETD